ncbi:hypothetical protein [Pseudarthrobacter sp. S9]|uniref:hypothetical protein n=1 Tax=Pseudarthrobacter sp. S9 TaxID=3418421 RepID=UPI003D03D9DF
MTAQEKLVEARRAMRKFKAAQDPQDIRSEFYKALSALKTAAGRLQSESLASVRGLPDAKVRRTALVAWWKLEDKRQKADGVIGWVFKARDADQHIEASGAQLLVGGHASGSWTVGPGSPGSVVFNGSGLFGIDARGTPMEATTRYPFNGSYVVQSSLSHPPTIHRGKTLERTVDPEALLRMSWDYLDELWHLSRSEVFGEHVKRELKKGRQ